MRVSICFVAALACACGDSGTVPTPAGSRHVTQGGAQDIALFRSIVARGQVPASETLDEVGFFAEHAADLPPADCGEDVCLHPMLAVAPRFDGGNWTMAFVGLNSPVDPSTSPRPPMHVIVVAEQSSNTRALEGSLRDGARAMAAELRPEDRMSVVTMGETATIAFHGRRPEEVDGYFAAESTPYNQAALYEGLATAAELTNLAGFEGETRILLVTSGHANFGIGSSERLVALAESLVQRRIGISVIGAGTPFENGLVSQLGDLGAGRYAYAEDGSDLVSLMRDEAALSLIPLATNFSLEIQTAEGYRVGRIYGARRAAVLDGRAWLASPALFLGRHEDAAPTGSRRGGGGGLFVELIADGSADVAPGATAFTLSANWTSTSGRTVHQEIPVENALAPGQNPAAMWPDFTAPEHGNVFMMLNMYLALKTATEFYETGDCARSLGVVDMMAPSVESWQVEYGNEDVWADFDLLLDVRDNVQAQCSETPIPPQFFEGSCFAI